MESSAVLMESPVSPEVESKPLTYLKLEVNEGIADREETRSAEKMFDILNLVGLWSFLRAEYPTLPSTVGAQPINATGVTLSNLNAEINGFNQLLIRATQACDTLSGSKPDKEAIAAQHMAQIKRLMKGKDVDTDFEAKPLLAPVHLPSKVRKLYEKLKQKMGEPAERERSFSMGVKDIPLAPVSIHVGDEQDLIAFFDIVARATHDIKAPMAVAKGHIQLTQRNVAGRYEKNRPTILTGYNGLQLAVQKQIADLTRIMKEKAELRALLSGDTTSGDIDDIWAEQIVHQLVSSGFILENLDFNFTNNLNGNIHLAISPSFLQKLMANIAANCANAYNGRKIQENRNFKMTVQLSQDGKFGEIICSNTGTMYPPKIVKDGFTGAHGYGDTEVVSSGSGMMHAKRDLGLIGGDIIPGDLIDKNGNIIGAQTTIRIPLKSI